MIVEIVLGLILLLLAAWAYSRWRFTYWSSRGVQTAPYLPFLGHIHKTLPIFREPWLFIDTVYKKYGGSTLSGIYEMLRPNLMVGDPALLRSILVKDFDHFTDRRTLKLDNKNDKIMSEMLSMKTGEEWKTLRSIMTPSFTSGKIRGMFPLVCSKADSLVSYSLEMADTAYVDMKDACGRFTMDTIASCAFGIECNSFKEKKPEFPEKASIFFSFTPGRLLKLVFLVVLPRIFKALKFSFNPPEIQFFSNVIKETVNVREKGQVRGDFLDLLMEARARLDNPGESKKVLNDDSMVAQSVLFLLAGYDTTASTLAFTSFLLAKHQWAQQRLRQEVQEMVQEHGGITYQGIMEAKFLDACLNETLRLYPPAPLTERVCTKKYKIPGTELVLSPGDLVLIPIWSLHHDSRYWPQPYEFQPQRFLPENKADITPYTHLPFGLGPRNCIAMRFALMEAKVALAKLMLSAKLELAPGHEELVLDFRSTIMRPKDGVRVRVTRTEAEGKA